MSILPILHRYTGSHGPALEDEEGNANQGEQMNHEHCPCVDSIDEIMRRLRALEERVSHLKKEQGIISGLASEYRDSQRRY